MKAWTKSWKASAKPRKQRKFSLKAPLHLSGDFVAAHLSKELRAKHKMRAIRLRKGDKVKIMRGNSSGKSGKVERIDVKQRKVYITGIDVMKRDGSKALQPIHPSKLLIEELDLTDKRRMGGKQ